MGARLSLLAPLAPTVAILSYIDIVDGLEYQETLNNSRYLKAVRATNAAGQSIVVKLFIKPLGLGLNIDIGPVTELIARQSQLLGHFPHCLPYTQLLETDRAGYMQRRWMGTNLYDRLSLRPFFDPVERLFVVYQMLVALRDLHQQLQVHHGDLKLENFLCTLWGWVIITDFATYTKPTFLPADNPNQFSFYFDTSNRRLGYVAPERFYDKDHPAPPLNIDDKGDYIGHDALTDAMDLFSLGCCIAELYLDGEPPFTLSQLFKYMKNQFKPDLSPLHDLPELEEIVSRLTSLDPSQRPAAADILEEYRTKLFPDEFESAYPFIKSLSQEADPDARIDLIYDGFTKLMGSPTSRRTTKQSDNATTSYSIVPYRLWFPGMDTSYVIQPRKVDDHHQYALLYLNVVFATIKHVVRVPTMIKAIELILAFLEHISDENKLDRSLPYLCYFFDEYYGMSHLGSPLVVATALACTALLLQLCAYINPINVGVFSEYLLPKISQLAALASAHTDPHHRQVVMTALAAVVPHLALTARRFWTMAKPFKIVEYDRLGFDHAPEDLLPVNDQFEALAFTLLTDSQVPVKVALVHNIAPLCQYFGIDKTVDVILPHLITYLNHSLYELKLAFLELVMAISPVVGVLTFEQYLLPLLIQTLGDLEPLVVIKVLEVFVQVVVSGLINPKVEFNAIDVYNDLLSHLLPLLLHPVEWIRQLVLCLVCAISDKVTDADRYTFLYPLLKPYLRYDTFKLDWDLLYPFLAKPLLKHCWEIALQWLMAASLRLLFWQVLKPQQQLSVDTLGKLVYLPRTKVDRGVPLLSPEDKHWIFKLRLLGFDDKKEMWKLGKLREYIWVQARNRAPINPVGLLPAEIPPHNVFMDVIYKDEPLADARMGKKLYAGVKGKDLDQVLVVDDSSQHLLLIFPNRKSALLQTSEATVYGELDTPLEEHDLETSTQMQRVVKVTSTRVITAKVRFLYQGDNSYIWRYLHLLPLDPDLANYSEFGPQVPAPAQALADWTPQHTVVARVIPNSGDVDGFTTVKVCPLHEFFVTGLQHGKVTVWDARKLEKLVTHAKESTVLISLNSQVVCIRFLPHRFSFVVVTEDGMVRVLRVSVVRGKGKKLVKLSGITTVRQVQLGAPLVDVDFFARDDRLLCVGVTTSSKMVVMDVCDMERVAEWAIKAQYGMPTLLCVGDNSWAIVGTSQGKVLVWDLRFGIPARILALRRSDGSAVLITQVLLVQVKLSGAEIAIAGNGDTTVWSIPLFECRQIFGARGVRDRRYQLVEMSPEVNLEELFAQLTPTQGPTMSMCVADAQHMVVLVDKTIVSWNSSRPDQLVVVNNAGILDTTERHGSYMLKEYEPIAVESHQDVITGVAVTTVPYPLTIAVDRVGHVYIYK